MFFSHIDRPASQKTQDGQNLWSRMAGLFQNVPQEVIDTSGQDPTHLLYHFLDPENNPDWEDFRNKGKIILLAEGASSNKTAEEPLYGPSTPDVPPPPPFQAD